MSIERKTVLQHTDDLRIDQLKPLIPPAILMEELPLTEAASNTVVNARRARRHAILLQQRHRREHVQ